MRYPDALSRPRGATLVELLVVVAIATLLASLVLPAMKRGFDRLMARGAARETATAFHVARAASIAAARPTAVRIDREGRVAVVRAGDTLLARWPARTFRVAMRATRDSMAYTAAGLGFGAANLSVIHARGSAAETVVVSREGRVRVGGHRR